MTADSPSADGTPAKRFVRLRRRLAAGAATGRDEALVAASGLLGALLGAIGAEALAQRIPLPSGSVEAARAAGIVSATIRAGYSKDGELLFLAIGLALTAAGALLAGVATAYWRGRARPPLEPAPDPEPRMRFGWLEAVALLAVLLAGAEPTPLLTAGHPWRILAEEGAHLFPASALSLGGRLYEDAYYLYGPLLVLPLAAVFSLGTPSVYAARLTVLALHGVGLALAAAAGRALFRSRIGWLACCAALALFVPLAHPRLHLTALRTSVSLVPLLFLPAALRGRAAALVAAGASVCVAAATSPEVGAVTLLACAAVIALASAGIGRARALALFVAGVAGGAAVIAALLLPYVDVLQYLRDGASTLASTRLGYLSRPFPVPWGADRLWWGDPHGIGMDASTFLIRGNAIPALIATCGVVLAFRWLRRPLSVSEWLTVAVWLIALGLLPKLVVRPGPHQFAKLTIPLLLVIGALAERGFSVAARRRGLDRLVPGALSAALLLALAGVVHNRVPSWPPRFPDLETRLGPIPVDPEFAGLIGAVRAAVDRRLARGEPIWVTPNAMGWTMLLDRPSAVRNPAAVFLATAAEREAVLRVLREHPPPLLLRHRMRDELDGVPMDAYAPELAAFVDSHYRVAERVRRGRYSVEILVRDGGDAPRRPLAP